MSENHVMLDLETLGTEVGSIVISIGAVRFNPYNKEMSNLGPEDTFYKVLDPVDSQKAGLTIDASTVLWWMQQSEEARKALTHVVYLDPINVLKDFATFLGQDAILWGNGSDFDNVLLAKVYRVFGWKRLPWSFRNNRCYRTVKNLYPGIALTPQGITHNALDDALAQAEHLCRIFARMKSNE